jgi:hypothetical protein
MGKIWKEAVIAYFKARSQNFLTETKENIETSDRIVRSQTNYNSILPKYEARMLTTCQSRLVQATPPSLSVSQY